VQARGTASRVAVVDLHGTGKRRAAVRPLVLAGEGGSGREAMDRGQPGVIEYGVVRAGAPAGQPGSGV
jgi:hypothetical protein